MQDQEETEQLDQESEIPTPFVKIDANSSEKNQENEQKYIKSIEIEDRLEGKNQVSNNQFEIVNKMDEPAQKSSFKNSPGDDQDKSDDSVKIKLDLDQSYKQQNDIGRDTSNPMMTKVEDTNIIVTSNINENTQEVPKARWEKSQGNNSQPAIQIEREEADKAGGM